MNFLPKNRPVLFLIISFLIMILCCYFSTLFLPNLDSEKFQNETSKYPYIGNSKIRRFFTLLCGIVFRIAGFVCFGLYWIEIEGVPAKKEDAPIVIFYPHANILDPCCFFRFTNLKNKGLPFLPSFLYEFSFVLAAGIMKLLDLRGIMGIPINRQSSQAKLSVKKQIHDRAQDMSNSKSSSKSSSNSKSNWFQILLAPEGTAMNGTAILPFKTGAFEPGLPVQPVRISIKNPLKKDLDQISLASFKNNSKVSMIYNVWLRYFMNLSISAKLTFDNVIVPDEREKINCKLFADNVRTKISEISGIPKIDFCYEDDIFCGKFREIIFEKCQKLELLLDKDDKNSINPAYGLVKFFKLSRLYKVNFKTIDSYFNEYLTDDEYTFHFYDCKTASIKFYDFLKILCRKKNLSIDLCKLEFEKFGIGFEDGEVILLSDCVEMMVVVDRMVSGEWGKNEENKK